LQVKRVYVEKRSNEIVNRLNKTKVESFPDLAQERVQRDKLDRHSIRQKELEQVKRNVIFLIYGSTGVHLESQPSYYYPDRTSLTEKPQPKLERQKRRLITCSANVIWSATIEIRKLRISMLLKKTSCNLKQGDGFTSLQV
jgi:hypothetical protein